jgi:hypothetical protein
VQAQAGFEFAVVVLDPPPDLGQAHQFFDGGVLGQGGQPVAFGLLGLGWPFGQQPARREAAVSAAGDVSAVRAGPDGHNAAGHDGGGVGRGWLWSPAPRSPAAVSPCRNKALPP